VIGRGDDQPALGARQRVRSIDGVLEERASPGERAVLLGLVVAEPLLHERPHPLPLASGEHDGPEPSVVLVHQRTSGNPVNKTRAIEVLPEARVWTDLSLGNT